MSKNTQNKKIVSFAQGSKLTQEKRFYKKAIIAPIIGDIIENIQGTFELLDAININISHLATITDTKENKEDLSKAIDIIIKKLEDLLQVDQHDVQQAIDAGVLKNEEEFFTLKKKIEQNFLKIAVTLDSIDREKQGEFLEHNTLTNFYELLGTLQDKIQAESLDQALKAKSPNVQLIRNLLSYGTKVTDENKQSLAKIQELRPSLLALNILEQSQNPLELIQNIAKHDTPGWISKPEPLDKKMIAKYLNKESVKGVTKFSVIIKEGTIKDISTALKYGADPDLISETALDTIKRFSESDLATLEHEDQVKLLKAISKKEAQRDQESDTDLKDLDFDEKDYGPAGKKMTQAMKELGRRAAAAEENKHQKL